MVWVRRALVALPVVGSMGMTCGPGVPEPDECISGEVGALSALELGAGEESQFQPLSDGATLDIIYGSQGGAMLAVRLRARGADVPECLAQHTQIEDAQGGVIARTGAPLFTYAQPDGSRATRQMLLIFDAEPAGGDTVTVRAAVGALETTRSVVVGPP